MTLPIQEKHASGALCNALVSDVEAELCRAEDEAQAARGVKTAYDVKMMLEDCEILAKAVAILRRRSGMLRKELRADPGGGTTEAQFAERWR
jgi:hypothetical protein